MKCFIEQHRLILNYKVHLNFNIHSYLHPYVLGELFLDEKVEVRPGPQSPPRTIPPRTPHPHPALAVLEKAHATSIPVRNCYIFGVYETLGHFYLNIACQTNYKIGLHMYFLSRFRCFPDLGYLICLKFVYPTHI